MKLSVILLCYIVDGSNFEVKALYLKGKYVTDRIKIYENSQRMQALIERMKRLEMKANNIFCIELNDIETVVKKYKNRHRTLEERAQEYGGKLGLYEEFD